MSLKILIIADEVWNDITFGNNVLSNWFQDFDADLAEIYCNPGTPKNICCEKYFQVTDAMMAKSILGGKKAGKSFVLPLKDMSNEVYSNLAEQKPQKFYDFMKSISSDGIRIIRDLIWLLGRYNINELQKFILDFNPDIIFCPRLLTPKLRRLEKIVSKITDKPFIAFTADDEASLNQISYSPLYWIRRIIFHISFGKHVSLYKHYFMFSEEQAKYYNIKYKIPTSVLFKCGSFERHFKAKAINTPIRIVYAGRLYCNRWKTLEEIGKALTIINKNRVEMILEIYTQDLVTKSQKNALSEEKYIYLKGSVPPNELIDIYHKSDIALHVESFDKKYKYKTKVSFSTKIIDLMSSTCAIMAICWEKHAGFQYLKENDAAFCISSYNDILPMLFSIVKNPKQITDYSYKAWSCGLRNHSKAKIQNEMQRVFSKFCQKS